MEIELGKVLISFLVDGKLPCPVAFRVAKKMAVAPRVVGDKADERGIRIVNCQLGCFGVKKATHEDLIGKPVDSNVAKAVQASLTSGQLPCEAAYEIAKKLRVSRRRVGDTATQLKIMIATCQLGCF